MTERLHTIIFLEILENGVPVFCVHGEPSAGMVLSVVDSFVLSKQIVELYESGKSNQEYLESIDRNKYEWKYCMVTYLTKVYDSSGDAVDGFLYDKPSGSGKHRRGNKNDTI